MTYNLMAEAKTALRITTLDEAIEKEIANLVEAAQLDLISSGIPESIAKSEDDSLVKQAVIFYIKANFGFDNPDFEKFTASYDRLKNHLCSTQKYTEVEDEI